MNLQETGKYDSILAAKYLQALAADKRYAPNATQLQKLLYIAYGTYLSTTGNILLKEQPQAWPYGPVFPRVQKKVSTAIIPSVDDPIFAGIAEDEEVNILFRQIIDSYSKYSAKQLSDWSHSKGSPWDLTVNRLGAKWSDNIPNEYIKEYFSRVNV
jgi:uncharacterized phage-associated protein